MAWQKILKVSMEEANFYGKTFAPEDYSADRKKYKEDVAEFENRFRGASRGELNYLIKLIHDNLNNPEKLREIAKEIEMPIGNLSDSDIIDLMKRFQRSAVAGVYGSVTRGRTNVLDKYPHLIDVDQYVNTWLRKDASMESAKNKLSKLRKLMIQYFPRYRVDDKLSLFDRIRVTEETVDRFIEREIRHIETMYNNEMNKKRYGGKKAKKTEGQLRNEEALKNYYLTSKNLKN